MTIVITILAVLCGIIAVLLLVALFIPKQYSVAVSQTIQKPKQVVFDYVRLLKNQLVYSEWLKADTTLQPEISGTDGTVGAVLKWESSHVDKNINAGKGEQEIKVLNSDTISVELRLILPMAGVCQLENHFVETSANATLYTCTFHAYAKYPINLPSYLIGRKIIRKAQQKTLDNLKAIVEQG